MELKNGTDRIVIGGIYKATPGDTLHIDGETQTYVITDIVNQYNDLVTEIRFTPPAIRDYKDPGLYIQRITIEKIRLTNSLVYTF